MSKLHVLEIVNWIGLIGGFVFTVSSGKDRNFMNCLFGLTSIILFYLMLTQHFLTMFEGISIAVASLLFSVGGRIYNSKRRNGLSKSNEAIPQTDERYYDKT